MEKIPAHVLLGAYTEGVFPMADEGEIHWFSPVMRGVIPVDDEFHSPHGLKKSLRKQPYEVKIDADFRGTVIGCSERDETWIDDVILETYCELHELGFAHSVECYDDDGLQGGLYGVALGKAFFGESMFSRKVDASKIALVHLVEWMRANDFLLLDTQWMTEHLRQFGGKEIPREQYMELLAEALADEPVAE